jgi:uncharacterized protein
MDGRRIALDVLYNNQSITADIDPFITDISFTDNIVGQADEISISLGDRERRWMNSWIPKKGASLEASLVISADWDSKKSMKRKLGYFEIDEISTSGPPNKVEVRGISVPESSSLRGKERTRAWEKASLKKVVQDIAKKNKLKLYFSVQVEAIPTYDRLEQQNETDLAFLMRICNEASLALKIANQTIYIFDEARLERDGAVTTISRLDHRLKSWNGNDTLTGIYKACTVSYTNPKTKKTYKYTFTPPKPPKTNKILYVNEEVTSQAAAIRLAKAKLRAENKNATTFSLVLAGFLNLYAGQTINLKDFGAFDGKYIITSFSGKLGSNSETSLELRKCLEGY